MQIAHGIYLRLGFVKINLNIANKINIRVLNPQATIVSAFLNIAIGRDIGIIIIVPCDGVNIALYIGFLFIQVKGAAFDFAVEV